MRSRTLREGSVGLLILLGLGLSGLMVIWIRGINPGNRSYRTMVDFPDAGGMKAGSPVRYRGVVVGRVTTIHPGTNVVSVEVEITPSTVVIPRDSVIQVNQAGLIGETSIDITPNREIATATVPDPLNANCKGGPIICDGDRLPGVVGVNFNELLTATVKLSNLFADPSFFNELRTLTKNSAEAAKGITNLTVEVTQLSRSVEKELSTLSSAATLTTAQVGRAANQIGLTATQVNELLVTNRSTLVTTLNNLNAASFQLRNTLTRLSPIVDEGQFVQNLQTLSVNASQASANLRNLSEALGSQENLLLLQQTLDSARATFQNAQKITADLDDLTGDPTFRENVRQLINGLHNLVSSTEQLHRQAELARVLEPAAIALQGRQSPPDTQTPPPQVLPNPSPLPEEIQN